MKRKWYIQIEVKKNRFLVKLDTIFILFNVPLMVNYNLYERRVAV